MSDIGGAGRSNKQTNSGVGYGDDSETKTYGDDDTSKVRPPPPPHPPGGGLPMHPSPIASIGLHA